MLVDLIIQAKWLIPVEPEQTVLHDHSLVVHQGRILNILPHAAALERYQPTDLRRLFTHALLPGLVNCHTHAAMTLLSGLADDLPLMSWLQEHIWPAEQKWVNPEFVADGVELAIAEMLRGGVTCFNDMYFFPEVTAQQAVKFGIRANLGLIVFDFPTAWAENADAYLQKGLALQQAWRGEPLLSASLAPHAPYTVSDAPLRQIKTRAEELGLTVHMHVHETAEEVANQRQQTGQTPLQRLHALGLLAPNFMAVHMTQLDAEDIALYAAGGGHIVHCPESNLKLASGFCPVAACLAAGVNVALGTDGSASNNDLDMFGEMRAAALLAKAVANDASAVPAHQALAMATLNGAKALGLDAEIGSLSIGKAADVIAVNLNEPATQPWFNPLSKIVYAAGRHQVSDVWVAGRHLLRDGELSRMRLGDLLHKAESWRRRIQPEAAGGTLGK